MTNLKTYKDLSRRITDLAKEIKHLKLIKEHWAEKKLPMVESTLQENLKVFAILFNREFDPHLDCLEDKGIDQ